jgi:holo-[acyl-carrier protein] synthase
MKHSDSSAVRGIGNDIIEIARMRQSIKRQGQPFLSRLFTERELEYCNRFKDPVLHFAGRFAAKEAIAKAFGMGLGAHIQWHDIEVINDDLGKPEVFLSPSVQKTFREPQILISISHCSKYAAAVALWIG